MKDLRGKTAFITGGANGIGLSLAQQLANEGMSVAITDIDGAGAEKAAADIRKAGGKSIGIKLDVIDLDQWTTTADTAERELGPVRLLCSNAGVASPQSIVEETPMEKITVKEWQWLLSVNITGQFFGVKTFVPRFKASNEESHILATASMAGIVPQFAAVPGAYTVSKYGSVGLYEQLRLELAPFPKIGLTILCPGVVATSIQKHTMQAAPYLTDTERSRSANNSYGGDDGMSFGMQADNVARHAINMVRAGEFYAFSHPEYGPLTRNYHANLMKGFGASAQPGYTDPLPLPT